MSDFKYITKEDEAILRVQYRALLRFGGKESLLHVAAVMQESVQIVLEELAQVMYK